MDLPKQVWATIKDAVDGLKTLCVAGLFLMLGFAEYFDVVNIKPVLDWAFGADRAAKMMIFLPVIFGTLRFLSSSAPRWSKKWREQKQDRLMRSEVDDPEVTPKEEGGQ